MLPGYNLYGQGAPFSVIFAFPLDSFRRYPRIIPLTLACGIWKYMGWVRDVSAGSIVDLDAILKYIHRIYGKRPRTVSKWQGSCSAYIGRYVGSC